MENFFTWATLGTCAGATAATALFTQLLKHAGPLERIPTRLFSYGVALVLLLGALAFTGQLAPDTAALCAVNAAVVSLAANGAYDAAAKKAEE